MSEQTRQGCLYLVATPIGNLEDMTFRAVRMLSEADLIAAEDTRNSRKLLEHFDIHTPMTSYHEHNKYDKAKKLVGRMLSGDVVALITDAGTPGISDPGEVLVRMCHESGIMVSPIPGAAACINALIVSGLPTRCFSFEAFLPEDKKQREKACQRLEKETRTIVLYEAPHRLVRTLLLLYERLGDRRVCVCRELTKRHESIDRTTLLEAVSFYESNPPKGECVIVLEGLDETKEIRASQEQYARLSVMEHVGSYEKQGMDRKQAMKAAARDRGVSKSEVYRALLLEEGKAGGNTGKEETIDR